MGILGEQGRPLSAGQLSTVCLVLPGALSHGGSKQPLTGGKGKLVCVGDSGGSSGNAYMTPRVCGNVGWGGGKEGGVSKEGGKVTGDDSWCKVKVLSPAVESLLRGRSSAISPLMTSS